jgi:hypothetical protein
MGHTPIGKDDMIEMVNSRKHAIIDRGLVYNGSDYGYLAILNLDNRQLKFIKRVEEN